MLALQSAMVAESKGNMARASFDVLSDARMQILDQIGNQKLLPITVFVAPKSTTPRLVCGKQCGGI